MLQRPLTRLNPQARRSGPAFTLIELTLVIAVLLGLISASFFGVNAYKEGANRAQCIQSISRVQQAVRVHSNYLELAPGDPAEGLRETLIAPGSYIPTAPTCPSGGEYSFVEGRVPFAGELFMRCSIEGHAPSNNAAW